MKMGNPYLPRPFLSVYLILYGLLNLQLACAALGDATTPSLEITLVSATYNINNNQYVDIPNPDGYDNHFGSAKLLDRSMAPPKSGISGYLFEITVDCSNITNITTNPVDSNLITLQRIAFISSPSCYMNGLNEAENQSVKGVILIANQDNQSPTLPENGTFGFPIFAISDEDGSALKSVLHQYNKPLGNNTTNRLKAIMSYTSGFFPGVWEFTLIIVVVLLAISFATSVAMHCHLYRIRRRQRRQRGQHGLIGHVGAKNLTLNTEMLAKFPVRTYKASSVSNHFDASSKQSNDEIKDNSLRMQEISENNEHVPIDLEAGVSTVDLSSSPISADDKNPSLRRNKSMSSTHSKKEGMHSRQVSIRSVRSTRSTKSVRSANAIASATTLAAGTSSNITPDDQSYNSTCAVCLEDFDEGDQLRTLICGHEYHTECIDPWLTQKSSLCPLCKHDCIPKTEHEEDPETLPDERNIYVGALLTWGPVVYFRNIFQRIRGRSSNNAETTQLGNNTNSGRGANESSTPLTNVEVRQHNTSTSLSRIQTNNSSHSVSQ